MKILVAASIFGAALAGASGASEAQAQSGFYVAPKVIWTHENVDLSSDDYSDGILGGALAFGYDFNNAYDLPVRVEFEAATRGKGKHEENYSYIVGFPAGAEGEMGVNSLFVNAFYDFHNQSGFTPYLGLGLGTAQLKAETRIFGGGYALSDSKTEWSFAWNVGAGVSYQFNELFALDLGYRYADFGSLSDDGIDVDVTGHEILLGGRFTF